MPLVKPKEKEKREDFIERCMGDKTSAEDYPSRNQRFAVCNSLYNQRNKKEKITMENYLRGYHDTDKDKMGMDEDSSYAAMIFACGGLGLVIGFFLTRKIDKEDNK